MIRNLAETTPPPKQGINQAFYWNYNFHATVDTCVFMHVQCKEAANAFLKDLVHLIMCV